MPGLFYSDTLAGRVFSQAATPLGLAIPIYTATAIAGGMPVWNPPGSNRNVELISVDIDFGSGTSVFGSIGLMAGFVNAVATASGMSAIAATVPVCGLIGGPGSRVVSSNAGTVTVTAGTATAPVYGVPGAGWVRSVADINLEASTSTPLAVGVHTYQFNGTVIVPQGVLVYLACTLASVALFASTIVWREVMVNPALG